MIAGSGAAEGVLQRSIGRGTYVADDQAPDEPQSGWLLLVDGNVAANPLVTSLLKLNPQSRCVAIGETVRPSLLAQYSVVVNCTDDLTPAMQRDLMVRGIPLIQTIEAETDHSTHCVLFDEQLAAFNLGRDLLLTGHTRIHTHAASHAITRGLELAAKRYAPESRIVPLDDVEDILTGRPAAIVCLGTDESRRLAAELQSRGADPNDGPVSLCTIGTEQAALPATGYYLSADDHACAIQCVIASLQPNRLSRIWHSGKFVDRGTTHAVALRDDEAAIAAPPHLTI